MVSLARFQAHFRFALGNVRSGFKHGMGAFGHKSLAMTLHYSHLSPDHKKRAVDILGKRMDTFRTLDDTNKGVQQKLNSLTIA